MRARFWQFFVAASLSGCSFEHGVAPDRPDASVEIDSGMSCTSFSSQLDTCALSPATDNVTLTGQNTYDTTTGTLMAGTTPVPITRMQVMGKAGPIELLLVNDFHMTANSGLRAVGDLPLAILAFNMIAIDGSAILDLSAGGAGARSTCTGGAIDGMPDDGGGGGGGGGGFAAAGGNGGNGDQDGPPPTPGGPGGTAEAVTPQGPLGGCPGARGGNGDDNGGSGGAAGGAIYLVAAARIDLAPGAGINAGGGGGRGGAKTGINNGDAGGGGGGSGGMIMIESPIVRSAGALAANGGGGGEASGGGGSGNPGEPGALALGAAHGGNGSSTSGTDGGDGGAQASALGASVTVLDEGGGGGGGGGVGYIFIKSGDAVISLVSPTPI
jgi:hypothetical protein